MPVFHEVVALKRHECFSPIDVAGSLIQYLHKAMSYYCGLSGAGYALPDVGPTY